MKTRKFFGEQQKFVFAIFVILFSINCFANPSDEIFDDSQILEFHITFPMDNFYEVLMEMHNTNPQQYLSATFEYNGEIYENVGVRFKGYKSMNYPGMKKPLKIKFNEFVEDQKFHGLTKLSLSNEYFDPTFLREKITYDILNEYVPSSRANFAKVYLNGQYWGLYTNVEQVNMKFIKEHFGNGEDGNLYKGDPAGDLIWNGPNPNHYYNKYELKTNQEENDWSDLINFIHLLNFTESQEMKEVLDRNFHMYNYMFFQAINNLLVNLDSYFCGGHNYYIYHRTDTDKFIHIPWDFNFAFGNGVYGMSFEEITHLSVLWNSGFERPLYEPILDVPAYKNIYLMDYRYVVEHSFQLEELFARIDYLADLIRPAVYADTLKMFSNEDFEENLNNDIYYYDDYPIFGLKSFLSTRIQSVIQQLNNYEIQTPVSGLFINEFMANNSSTICDENGDFDDWIEIYNANDVAVNMEGIFLTDDPQTPDKWQFPQVEIPAGGHLIVWADNEVEEGPLHANFKLNNQGEYIGLYNRSGILATDEIEFGAQQEDVSFGRRPDGSVSWQFLYTPTPGSENICSSSVVNVHINELMANNQGIICDEYGEFDDWIEIFNKNLEPLNLEGLFLTDDPEFPNKWRFPDVEIAPKGHLLIWADNEGDQGPLHANFKLNNSGEAVYIFDANAQHIIDQVSFGPQNANISYGRRRDGSPIWQLFSNPTPNQPNFEPTSSDETEFDKNTIFVSDNFPNPFNGETSIKLYLPQRNDVKINIYNVKGEHVKTLLHNNLNTGNYNIVWNGKDDYGKTISSGVYFYKVEIDKFSVVKRMILVN